MASILSSGKEIREPASWIIGLVAVSFALAKWRNALDPGFYTSPYFISILIAFAVHELAHKYVGRMYGMVTEFIANTTGILITLLSGLLPGIVIIAPGYVKTLIYSYTPETRRAVLASVAAGPASNILLGTLSYVLLQIAPAGASLDILRLLAYSVHVNGWIAFFNLLPVPPLDGSKIIRLNAGLWGAMIAVALILLLL